MRKLFGPTRKLRLFRLLRSGRMGDVDAFVHAGINEDREQTKTFNSNAYVLAKNRMHEIEAQKAMVLFESRHDKWKSGGAL
ncbi:MAG: hypothetical protein OEZ21_03635 [Candidatus Bathyarchaeota archaeon]|nr:hypothetical protein [Candidatus Bathyarchaeota archaeon]MDH5746032.1 hypothetical protein [Candidatus Bathyarchaeota archaeon]